MEADAITRLMEAADAGDAHAAEDLVPLVYDQLRRLAREQLRHEKPNQTLQATALVHEAYLRLVGPGRKWAGRSQFYSAAATAMRHILVDQARRKGRLKRGGNGGNGNQVSIEQLVIDDAKDDLLAIDEALTALSEKHPEKARLVTLRYFAGFTIEEAAQAMKISTATAERYWTYARAWLYRRLKDSDGG